MGEMVIKSGSRSLDSVNRKKKDWVGDRAPRRMLFAYHFPAYEPPLRTGQTFAVNEPQGRRRQHVRIRQFEKLRTVTPPNGSRSLRSKSPRGRNPCNPPPPHASTAPRTNRPRPRGSRYRSLALTNISSMSFQQLRNSARNFFTSFFIAAPPLVVFGSPRQQFLCKDAAYDFSTSDLRSSRLRSEANEEFGSHRRDVFLAVH
jgi:hypothetical protein